LFSAIDRWTQSAAPEKMDQTTSQQDHSTDPQQDFSVKFDGDWFGESESAPSFETPELVDKTPDNKPDPVSQAVSSSEKLPVDLEGALFRFGGDRAFMMEMCQEFKDHLANRVEELQAALQAGDIEKLGRLAHNLKGLSMNFNADALSGFAAKLETSGKQNKLEEAPALVEQIAAEVVLIQKYLAQIQN
jgi:HPt (histidine-containing phosphotransfer) domain-containing protein